MIGSTAGAFAELKRRNLLREREKYQSRFFVPLYGFDIGEQVKKWAVGGVPGMLNEVQRSVSKVSGITLPGGQAQQGFDFNNPAVVAGTIGIGALVLILALRR
jgi:hypothetical protein